MDFRLFRTSKYALFETKIFRNSDFASCARISVLKITRYTVFVIPMNAWNVNYLI